jgi:hypothetical protein
MHFIPGPNLKRSPSYVLIDRADQAANAKINLVPAIADDVRVKYPVVADSSGAQALAV